MALDETIGMCDLCGKEADANLETCHALFCTANCHREQGDMYHADCLKKFIAQGSKGTAKHLPSIPYSNFPCPKGKGRGSQPDVPCKGLAHHCKRVIVKSEPKAPPPQVVLEKRPKGLPKPKPPVPPKPAKPKAPPVTDFNPRAVRLPPVPTEPKADPLGRNLNGTPQAELPPGFVDSTAEAAKARQGKAAKKNKKKRAKRKEDHEQEGWDASSANGSNADPHAAADGLQGWDSAAAGGGGDAGGESSSAGGGRFITSISAFNALLSKHLDMSDDSEYEYESDDGSVSTAHRSDATPIPRWDHHQPQPPLQQQDAGEAAGWRAVDGKGRAVPPAVPPAGAGGGARAQHGTAQPAVEDPAELRRREEELLKAALEESLAHAAGSGVVPAAVDEEALLARAMQESLAAEQAQQQREMEEQAELLARFEAQRLQQQGAQVHSAHAGGAGGGWSAPTDADSDAWGSAGSADSATTGWALSQQSVSPYQQSAQQQTGYLPNPYAAAPAAPAAAAAPVPAPAPQVTPYITCQLPQPVYAASAPPAPLAATVSAPYAAPATATAAPAATPAPPAAYQPAALQQQQQQQQQMPSWLQPAAANSTAALGAYAGSAAYGGVGGGYPGVAGDYKAAPVAPAAAADDDDDDLDSLLALLNV